jgi:two-component system, chemotaxis family, sensor histidine kinase and response regulator PixL
MNDKELEIRRQFLDEAQEYLDTLDDALLGVADARLDIQKVNAALRAAHSIKGGAGMMGFHTLSALSHRLEDSFKVLKVQSQLDISPELEALLLGAVDSLRQVIECDRREQAIPDEWLATAVTPIFDQLYELLGEPQPEDAVSMLGGDDGRSIIPVLFETEVEGCLQRLQTVLENPEQPCLQEELSILAQELGDLGEMLQLLSFSRLCESVLQTLEMQPNRLIDIAQTALETWRYTQALVIAGEYDNLPTELGGEFSVTAAGSGFGNLEIDRVPLEPESTSDWMIDSFSEDWQTLVDNAALTESFTPEAVPFTPEAVPFTPEAVPFTPEAVPFTSEAVPFTPEAIPVAQVEDTPAHSTVDFTSADFTSATSAASEPEIADWPDTPIPDFNPPKPPKTADFRVDDGVTPPIEDNLDATVRVPVRQLNQLNDFFGELNIERNGLALHINRLRNLAKNLNDRLKRLEDADSELRTAYVREVPNPAAGSGPLLAAPNAGSVEAADGSSQFDALEMDRYDSLHTLSQQVMETIVQLQEVSSDIDLNLDRIDQSTRSLNSTSKKLQNGLAHLRMRPLSDVLDRFPRFLRELSLQQRKRVTLNVTGGQTLVDRNILEVLNDPFMHLIRNAFDHGIEDAATRKARGKAEDGEIEIRAVNRGNRTIITFSDDGGGIPLNKIRQRAEEMGLDATLLAAASDEDLLSLIFEPGFSTSTEVTILSGRGVGMDVVRDHLKQIRGDIKVTTQEGVGTTFTLSVPYTLSITRALLVESSGMLLAIPADSINEMFLLKPEDTIPTESGESLMVKGNRVTLVRLGRWLRFNCPRPAHDLEIQPSINAPAILMVNRGSEPMALQIDRAWTEQEVAVRRVEGNLPLPPGFSSCTVFGDGRVVPLVNVSEMLNWIASCEYSSAVAPAPATPSLFVLPPNASTTGAKPTILIIDDSINVRRFLALTLERASYRVEQAKDGLEALEKLQEGLKVQGIICDVEMPRLDGFGFLAKIKANPSLAPVPIAMLTSRSGDKHRKLATSLGASAYFSKPYNEQSLLATLEELIRQPVAR